MRLKLFQNSDLLIFNFSSLFIHVLNSKLQISKEREGGLNRRHRLSAEQRRQPQTEIPRREGDGVGSSRQRGTLNSEVCPEGAEIGFRDGACSVCTGYRLHPSAHNFAPIERERERPRVAQQRDEQRWKSVYVRAFICEWMSERVKDNNKRDEHGRTKMQRERERIRRSKLYTARNIRYEYREKGNALENKFL